MTLEKHVLINQKLSTNYGMKDIFIESYVMEYQESC